MEIGAIKDKFAIKGKLYEMIDRLTKSATEGNQDTWDIWEIIWIKYR